MIKKDDINSTEKLLELIRSKGASQDGSDKTRDGKHGRPAGKWRFGARERSRKNVTVGIDINETDITLAAVDRISEKNQKLLDIRRVPLGPDIKKGGEAFSKLLKSTLKEFTGKYKKTTLWATISSADVETRFLRIPKVPARQVPNAVRWAFQKESSINESRIFDFNLIGTTYAEGEQKRSVLAYTAPKSEIEAARKLFNNAGFSLNGISIVPFAIQNLLRAGWLESSGKNVCALFIGSDWSRITIFSRSVLVLSRDIKAGARSMVQAILETLDSKSVSGKEDSRSVSPPEDEITIESAAASRNLKKAERIFDDFLSIRPTPDGPHSEIKREKLVFGMFKPALDRVIRQVEMTLEHFGLNYESDTITDVYISGELSSKKSVVNYFGKQLGLAVEPMNPFGSMSESTIRNLQTGNTFSDDVFVPATGMALSENETTPNFIFTYAEKKKNAFTQKFNRVASIVFIMLISMTMGLFYYQTEMVKAIKADIRPLQMELESYSPRLDRNLMAAVTGETVNKMKAYTRAAGYYLPLAVITELLEVTPAHIELLNVQAILGTVSSQEIKRSGKVLNISGVVSGQPKFLDRELTNYLVELKRSPLFSQPEIKEKRLEATENGEVLKFVLSLSISSAV